MEYLTTDRVVFISCVQVCMHKVERDVANRTGPKMVDSCCDHSLSFHCMIEASLQRKRDTCTRYRPLHDYHKTT